MSVNVRSDCICTCPVSSRLVCLLSSCLVLSCVTLVCVCLFVCLYLSVCLSICPFVRSFVRSCGCVLDNLCVFVCVCLYLCWLKAEREKEREREGMCLFSVSVLCVVCCFTILVPAHYLYSGLGTGVCIDRVSVCTFKTSACVPAPSVPSPHFSYMWAWCRYTRGLFERTHGGVLNVHTGVFTCFSPCRTTPHQTHTTTTTTPRPQRHNTETETEREREDETRQEGKTREERR